MATMQSHTDVVCPPDQEAFCRNCGEELLSHLTQDPDDTPTLGDAMCVGARYIRSWGRIEEQFVPEIGETLDCPDQTGCTICHTDMCSEHSNEFTSCIDGGIHHPDCGWACKACQAAAAEDHWHDRAETITREGY